MLEYGAWTDIVHIITIAAVAIIGGIVGTIIFYFSGRDADRKWFDGRMDASRLALEKRIDKAEENMDGEIRTLDREMDLQHTALKEEIDRNRERIGESERRQRSEMLSTVKDLEQRISDSFNRGFERLERLIVFGKKSGD